MNKNFYWFYIEPYTYFSIKQQKILLFNTLSSQFYIDELKPEVDHLLKKIKHKNNLWVAKLFYQNLKNRNIRKFVNETRKLFMSDLIKSSSSFKKPIQFVPFIKINNELNFESKDKLNSGKAIVDNLHEITFYINNDESKELYNYSEAYKQFNSFLYNQKYHELDFIYLKKIISDEKYPNLIRINISGGNIFKYSRIFDLICILNKKNISIEYNIHYSFLDNLITNVNLLNKIIENYKSTLNVIVTNPDKINDFEQGKILLKKKNLKVKFIFIIIDKNQMPIINSLIEKFAIFEFEMSPFFNKKNLDFFIKNVFHTKTDILTNKINHNDILIRGKINPILFGKLTILDNGSIHSNVNNLCMGNIKQNSLREVIYREMLNKNTWMKTRNRVQPCRYCLFCDLCPPISNYEFAFKRYDLCTIN